MHPKMTILLMQRKHKFTIRNLITNVLFSAVFSLSLTWFWFTLLNNLNPILVATGRELLFAPVAA